MNDFIPATADVHWRGWQMDTEGLFLVPINGLGGHWLPNEPKHASCLRLRIKNAHPAPQDICNCGVYALKCGADSAAQFIGACVFGSAYFWGIAAKKAVHSDIVRYEYAYPKHLFLKNPWFDDALIGHLAEKYSIKAVVPPKSVSKWWSSLFHFSTPHGQWTLRDGRAEWRIPGQQCGGMG